MFSTSLREPHPMGRGNPAFLLDYLLDYFSGWLYLDCFASLAMTRGRHGDLPHKNRGQPHRNCSTEVCSTEPLFLFITKTSPTATARYPNHPLAAHLPWSCSQAPPGSAPGSSFCKKGTSPAGQMCRQVL